MCTFANLRHIINEQVSVAVFVGGLHRAGPLLVVEQGCWATCSIGAVQQTNNYPLFENTQLASLYDENNELLSVS